jgi:hypothetical protein
MWMNFRSFRSRKFSVIALLLLAIVVFVAIGAESQNSALGNSSIARGAGKTIIEGGTGPSGGFVRVITTVAFHAERTDGGVTGAFECLALVPRFASGPDSGIFNENGMYVTGTVKTAVVNGDSATLTGTATITGLGAGNNVPFTFTAHQGGPGTKAVLVTGGLRFNETLLEGQFEFGKK